MFPDPGLAKNNFGGNLYLFYDYSEDIGAEVSAGFQTSDIISSGMGDNATSMVGRLSNTGYADARIHFKDLKFQSNFMDGWQDIIREDTGFKIDVFTSNSSLEYDIKFDKLEIRPGIFYQYSTYNDLSYLKVGQGFLNGKREFDVKAASVRMEYKPIEPLRLIAALRGEKYNTHDDLYFSYQFMGSYNLHDRNLFRIVVSRANRSPFLVDSYADYLWNRDRRPNPGYIYFRGTQNLDLLTMDQYEIGYRVKPTKAIQIDIEGFYTKTTDFGGLYPDSVNLNLPNTETKKSFARMSFQNIDLESTQIGASATITYIVNKDFFFKAYGTIQQTNLKNAIISKQEDILATMLTTTFWNYNLDTANNPQYYTGFPVQKEDKVNKATPSFYSGFVLDYKMLEEKLHFNLNTYFMTKQSFESKYYVFEDGEKKDTYELGIQLNLNLKVSYNLINGLDIFINARNLASNNAEFAFLDEIKPIILGGISYKF